MKLVSALLMAICFCVAASAQTIGAEDNKRNREVMRMGLYPPDIIMQHQQRLGITDAQRRSISKAVREFQTEVAELQWTLQNEQQLMRQSFSGYHIDTDKAMAQVKRVLELESRFKQAHFKLLIATKNELTEEQIDMINGYIKNRP